MASTTTPNNTTTTTQQMVYTIRNADGGETTHATHSRRVQQGDSSENKEDSGCVETCCICMACICCLPLCILDTVLGIVRCLTCNCFCLCPPVKQKRVERPSYLSGYRPRQFHERAEGLQLPLYSRETTTVRLPAVPQQVHLNPRLQGAGAGNGVRTTTISEDEENPPPSYNDVIGQTNTDNIQAGASATTVPAPTQ